MIELKKVGEFNEEMLPGINNTRKYPEDHPKRQKIKTDNLVLPRLRQWRRGMQSKELEFFCKNVGIPVIKFNDLRTTFTINQIQKGGSLPEVMSIIGHTDIKTAKIYLEMSKTGRNFSTKRGGSWHNQSTT